MKLYFLRHADALDGPDDDARPLSPLGKKQCRSIAKFLKDAGVEFDAAFSSPLARAVQTAEIVLKVRPAKKRLKQVDALRNETSQPDFNRWLLGLQAEESILLVGHAPSLTRRVCRLLGISNPKALILSKAGLACVETEDGQKGSLAFFLSPKVLR